MNRVRVALPELANPIIAEAVAQCPEIEAVGADDLVAACKLVAGGEAAALVAGIDYTSREVILACRDYIGMTGQTFSASFVMQRDTEIYVIGDAAACKQPTAEQLFDITVQTVETAKAVLEVAPRVAMLSFSTLGSGGKDESIAKIQTVLERLRLKQPELAVDGEMQLDAAVNERVGAKKAPASSVAGKANVLILPDLNSGNILYKAMEQFGGFTAAGPILQGFKAPASDLSRGSTVEDVVLVLKTIVKLVEVAHG